ncbi:hypothetical protein L284_17270 [Novosphingobium lindaniclasticum LE124]|uniref:Uncharacterized protein n=1 Tax=Novosphingobium lindaniclasticum LE124 TaxID=1096930 RepID=T0HDW2_9SPHN|nr:hypothetical protein L284_17270 [Novosphingobium lindaniclasticum LE124]
MAAVQHFRLLRHHCCTHGAQAAHSLAVAAAAKSFTFEDAIFYNQELLAVTK